MKRIKTVKRQPWMRGIDKWMWRNGPHLLWAAPHKPRPSDDGYLLSSTEFPDYAPVYHDAPLKRCRPSESRASLRRIVG